MTLARYCAPAAYTTAIVPMGRSFAVTFILDIGLVVALILSFASRCLSFSASSVSFCSALSSTFLSAVSSIFSSSSSPTSLFSSGASLTSPIFLFAILTIFDSFLCSIRRSVTSSFQVSLRNCKVPQPHEFGYICFDFFISIREFCCLTVYFRNSERTLIGYLNLLWNAWYRHIIVHEYEVSWVKLSTRYPFFRCRIFLGFHYICCHSMLRLYLLCDFRTNDDEARFDSKSYGSLSC